MADSSSNLDLVIQAQASKEVTINALADAASPATVYGRRQSTTSGLTWGYYGGRWGGFSIANGTQLLGASTTTYMVVLKSTGVVSFSTATTNWNDATNYARAYKIVTNATAVASYEDHRAGAGGVMGGGGSSSGGAVSSVNGKTGIVVLTPADVGAATVTQGGKADTALQNVTAGANITIDKTDPLNPVISAASGGGGMANPMTAVGDLVVGGASGTPTRLPKGADGQVLGVVAGAPAWVASGSSTIAYPPIDSENSLWTDEGYSTSGWTASGTNAGTFASLNSALHFGTNSATAKKALTLPAANDYILYASIQAANVPGGYAYLQLDQGATAILNLIFGYDWTTSTAVQQTVSYLGNASTQKGVLATGFDYTGYVKVAIHVDRNRGQINFWFLGADGKWDFKGSTPYFAAMSAVNTLNLTVSGTNAAQTFDIDWIQVSRPNIVAIGDSIAAGHSLFDPDPAVYVGLDNADSTIWKHAKIYPALRNNLIVNKGIGGQTSAQTQARIAEATAHGAKLVLLQASANDYGVASAAARTTNIQASINSILAAGAACVLWNPVYVNANYGGTKAAYNTYMQDWWANQRPTITGLYSALDLTVPVAAADGTIATANAQADGIHPNIAGFTLMGAYMAGFAAMGGPSSVPASGTSLDPLPVVAVISKNASGVWEISDGFKQKGVTGISADSTGVTVQCVDADAFLTGLVGGQAVTNNIKVSASWGASPITSVKLNFGNGTASVDPTSSAVPNSTHYSLFGSRS